jgi:hypothetical protein
MQDPREFKGFKLKLLLLRLYPGESLLPAVLSKYPFRQCNMPCYNPSADLASPPVTVQRQHKLRRNQILRLCDKASWRLVVTPQFGFQLLERDSSQIYWRAGLRLEGFLERILLKSLPLFSFIFGGNC